jgi:molybdopterin molybdotransferase
MNAPLPLAEAQARLLALAAPLPAETLPTSAVNGRYLLENISARRTQPAADLSAMDGYAMRADDLSGPWRVVGESAAGHPFAGSLAPGETIRISTGAHMPAGGGAVLLQEDAAREGDMLTAAGDSPSPRHIRRAGFDFAGGTPLLAAGQRLNPARIALALSGGHGSVAVGRLPRIAVLDSGDELAADPAACLPHQIPASNGAMLAAMASPLAADVRRIGPVVDSMEALAAALVQAEGTDVLVTSGGASVGDHDLIRPALAAWGAEIDFWRVAIKPGKPLMVARRGGTIVIGLPGNPVSSFVTAFLFLLPLLRRLAGAAEPLPGALHLPLAAPMPACGKRTEFARGRITADGVAAMDEQDSSALVSLAGADCLIERAAGAEPAASGSMVRVFPLAGAGGA